MLYASKEQNEILKTETADSRHMVIALQQQLSEERSKVESLEQKLLDNKQAMRQLYKNFSAFMEEENERSPVIALRPEYGNRKEEEVIVH
jgi:TolA-binding protein